MMGWNELAVCGVLGNTADTDEHLMGFRLRNWDVLEVHGGLAIVNAGDESFAG
jgi:hypothetical protein